ncbi:NAD(P)/FAD-dependent oxidoreductase [Luethyella okanaganae]|uniref:NAD(P)/FAD-dependent oxidoreductase n=1 Tax=Luethyella okanaganae TaxID=69372 RepID=A0ABW1VJ57_9MICO
MNAERFVIVGGGLAGAKAAETLRKAGFGGRITIVCGEAELPYIRPPLSKAVLTGADERTTIYVHPAEWYAERDIELSLGRLAVGLRPRDRSVTLDDGSELRYERLLLATGASARELPGAWSELDGIRYLRTVQDSDRLRTDFAGGGRRVVVVGSGWIGLEVAAAAASYGNRVTVLGREVVPLATAIGNELGEVFAAEHRAHGVELRMRTTVRRPIGADGVVTGVELPDGEIVPADVVVVGVGAVPNVELAEAAGLAVNDGILVDASLRSSDEAIFACGDVANAFHPVLGRHLRVEHWANALRSAPVAARAMLGGTARYERVPYFYSDQFGLSMEYAGYSDLARDAAVSYRGDPASGSFIAFWTRNGRVVAGANVNAGDVNHFFEPIIRAGARHDPARLTDPSVSLESLAEG